MLDIKFLRSNPELVKENIRKKFQEEKVALVDEVIELDEKCRAARTRCEYLRSQRNTISKQIGGMMAKGQKEEAEQAKAQVTAMAQELGYKTVFWSLAYVDWNNDSQPTREEAFAKLLPRIHNGAVVLLHSTSKTNAAILDELLTKWEEMGYRFDSVEALFA